MESQRRTQSSSQSPTPTPAVVRPGGAPLSPESPLAKYGNTALTVVLVIAAVVLAYRWWSRSADAARAVVLQQLQTARGSVDQLRSPAVLLGPNGLPAPSADVAARVRMIQTNATGLLSDVINKAETPAVKARALVARGDLAWAVANLPELPGATTQPALKFDPPTDVLLGQAADAYTTAIDLPGADKESVEAAHLGLAAVAENRHDWPTAKQHLQAVADDANGIAVLTAAAKADLAQLPVLQQPLYLVPPTEPPPAPATTTRPTTRPGK